MLCSVVNIAVITNEIQKVIACATCVIGLLCFCREVPRTMARVLVALRSRRLAFLSRGVLLLWSADVGSQVRALLLYRVRRDGRARRSLVDVVAIFLSAVVLRRRLPAAAAPRRVAVAVSAAKPRLGEPSDTDRTQSATAAVASPSSSTSPSARTGSPVHTPPPPVLPSASTPGLSAAPEVAGAT